MPVAANLYYYAFDGGSLESPPIVLIHGAGGTHLSWPPEIRRLTGYRVYAIDLPGHGKSSGYGQQTIEFYTEGLESWLDSIRLHRAVFVGYSMGGAIALTLALRFPEHVAGLGLIATAARLKVEPDILRDIASPTTFIKGVQAIVNASFSPTADPRTVELAAKKMAETRPTVLYGDLLASSSFDVTEDIVKIRTPTLVLCGSDDRITPLRNSQFLAGTISGAALDVISHAGHMVVLEQPQTTAQALRNFMQCINHRPGQE